MKRFLSILLAVAMIATMSVAAFAETISNIAEDVDKEIVVNGKYVNNQESGDAKTVVDIAWANLTFTYTVSAVEWDETASVLDWVDTDEGAWTGEGTVTVTNRSSHEITTEVDFVAADGIEVDAIITEGAESLEAGLGNEIEATWKIAVDPDSAEILTDDVEVLGNVTVAIAAA